MSWSYRVLVTDRPEATMYQIVEVYTDSEGRPATATARATAPFGESLEDLERDLAAMCEALRSPLLRRAASGGDVLLEEVTP